MQIEDLMIKDAEKYLVPKLRDAVPFDQGHLRRSMGAVKYAGMARRDAESSNFHLVQQVSLLISGIKHSIAVGAVLGGVLPRPAVYGHIRYQVDDAFRQRWNRIIRNYRNKFGQRVQLALGMQIGIFGGNK